MSKQPPKYNPQSNNLSLRGTTWHVRMDVPPDARKAFNGRRVLCKSLRTGNFNDARRRADEQLVEWRRTIDAFRASRLSTDEWQQQVAGKAANFHALTRSLAADVAMGDLPNPAEQLIEHGLDGVREKWLEHDVLSRIYIHLKDAGRYSDDDTVRAPALWLSSEPDPAKRLKMLLGLLEDTFLDLYTNRTKAEKNEAAFIVSDPASYKPKSPITKKLQEDYEQHLPTQVGASSAHSYALKVKTFSDWLTASGRTIDFSSVSDFLDSISKNANTRRTYIAALSKFHKWAIRYSSSYKSFFPGNENPFTDHEHAKQGDDKGRNWTPFTKDEVEKLYAVASQNGDTDLADLIMTAAYTGCRISELARLRVSLVTIVDDQPYSFSVEDAKTKAGNREIPIHAALVPMFKKRLAAPYTPNEFLFPGPDRIEGNLRIPALSERFTKLKQSLNFTELHCFHSIRKTTTTELLRAKVDPIHIPFIIGHETGKITFDVYTDGLSIEQKTKAIRMLYFNFSNQLSNN